MALANKLPPAFKVTSPFVTVIPPVVTFTFATRFIPVV